MDFFSPIFFGFFLSVLILYYYINPNYQKYLLFLASSLFIVSLSAYFLIYTYAFIVINYVVLYFIEKYFKNDRYRKIISFFGIVFNVGSLIFFKYVDFLIGSVFSLVNIFAGELSFDGLGIIIPIGISYFTFQGIGYIIQVNRGLENMEKDILNFSNYFIFFPKFLAGPIEQSKVFMPQLLNGKKFEKANITQGFRLILWGAFKKLVVADRLALVINGVYPNLDEVSGNVFLLTFLLQPLHLYFDFSGYTDIALGIGRTFGFKLTDNFNRPFFSTSVTEFWRRWHISLSAWCNEFIFKRLTFKNRRWGSWSPVYAVFVTFFVIGIWHGPRWNFIILGLLQGLAINYEFFTKRWRLKFGNRFNSTLVRYFSYISVYLFFCFTLIFFNAVAIDDALYFIKHLFSEANLHDFSLTYLYNFDKGVVLVSILFALSVEFRQEIFGKDLFMELDYYPKWLRHAVYYVICIFLIYLGSPDQNFVYMQF